MRYELTVWILNDGNMVRSYKTLEEAQARANYLMEKYDCGFVEIKLISETILFTVDKRGEIYTVYYKTDDWDDYGHNERHEGFLSLEEAETYVSYLEKQGEKYFDIEIEKYI